MSALTLVWCGGAVGAGLATGCLAAVPLVVALRQPVPVLAWGIAAVLASFGLLTLAILAVDKGFPALLAPFALAAVCAFVALTCIVALRSRR